jgi:hypothetical protein
MINRPAPHQVIQAMTLPSMMIVVRKGKTIQAMRLGVSNKDIHNFKILK